jgi:hypothetical protein
VLLRHGNLRAFKTVEDEFAEKGETDFARAGYPVLARAVDKVKLVRGLRAFHFFREGTGATRGVW